jgi:hypothetical protein
MESQNKYVSALCQQSARVLFFKYAVYILSYYFVLKG